eukprot:TRINITY_DN23133_c0_g1_i1.p1 TRINITY_DN23133_c0_g1~~TRINITY_DN23133_c0_g1_i1.p1  ORF type:complete len:103 (-),score=4.38 TRINITY_DN23133_c0_g1_i1:186-494(-)
MSEACPIQSEAEKIGKAKCTQWLQEYEECARRIKTYGSWDLQKLEHEAENKGIAIRDGLNNPLGKEKLAAQLLSQANCALQFFDYQACIDKVAAPIIFSKLK